MMLAVLVTEVTEGSLEVKLPTTWTDGKAEVGRVREEKRREEERRSEKRKSQKKEDVGARKGRKVARNTVFFSDWSQVSQDMHGFFCVWINYVIPSDPVWDLHKSQVLRLCGTTSASCVRMRCVPLEIQYGIDRDVPDSC